MINHAKTTLTFFNFFLNVENKRLPSIYWPPNLHKSTRQSMFITATPKCSLKPLFISITPGFKLMRKQLESYKKQSYFFLGVKSFWTILINQVAIGTFKI